MSEHLGQPEKDEKHEKPAGGRRAMLTGAAAGLVGAVLLSGDKIAHAANGDPLVVGNANTASSNTRLTMSGANAAFTVENTNASGAAHGASFSTVAGFGCATNSTVNHGSLLRTQSPGHFGAIVQNLAATAGTGGAVRCDGNQNMGLAATTDAASTPVIWARNLAADTSQAPGMMGLSGATAEQQLADRPAVDARGGGEFAGANGLVGLAVDAGGTGVGGINTHASGSGLVGYGSGGALAQTNLGDSEFYGNLDIFGTVTKLGGAFRIDHPLDPANKYLSHSFVESPDMKNVYDGVIEADTNGEATVTLPEWFEALNSDFRYQLTAIGDAAPELRISAKIADNRFAIAGAQPGQEVSWQVTGIRKDAWATNNRVTVEQAKPDSARGTYLYPEGFDKDEKLGSHAAALRRTKTR